MSTVSTSETKITIHGRGFAELFSLNKEAIVTYNEEPITPRSLEIKGDRIALNIPCIDVESDCPQSLNMFAEALISLLTGDVELWAALEDGEDPKEREEEFGEIVPFVSELYNRQDELLKTASYIHWETTEEDYEENVRTAEVFSYDAEHGERRSCEKTELEELETDVLSDFLDYDTCDFCNRAVAEEEILRKRMPDGTICTVCEECAKEYDLSDWESIEDD